MRSGSAPTPDARQAIQDICDAFDAAWQAADETTPSLERFLDRGAPEYRPTLLRALLLIDNGWRRRSGRPDALDVHLCRFPELESVVRGVLAETQTVVHASHEATRVEAEPHEDYETQLPGRTLGIYEVRRMLGRGAMGSVFLGWNPRLQRYAALKVLHQRLSERTQTPLELFISEARTAARLSHPFIVTVHALDEQQGVHFIALEYVEAGSLRDLMHQHGPLPEDEVAQWMLQTAQALEHAHRNGVLHRDIKPANILVCANGRAKLADFGLSTVAANNPESPEVDQQRRFVGTPLYLAPEVFWGHSGHTQASDIYALGATWYCLLTGQAPYPAKTLIELREQVGQREIVPIEQLRPGIHPEAARLIHVMLSTEPELRPRATVDLMMQLDEIARSFRPLHEIVRVAMEGEPVAWEYHDHEFAFHVRLDNGRGQTVFATVNEYYGQEFVCFFSPCAPPTPQRLEEAMRMNATLPLGALSLREWHGKPYLVMGHNQPRASLDPSEVRSTVRYLAQWADQVELRASGLDHH